MASQGHRDHPQTSLGQTAFLPAQEPKPLGREQWLVLAAAFLGWMFDGVEIGLFPLVARPALQELLSASADATVGAWNAVIVSSFLLGAALGGLVFGWLGDRIGRVRAMVLSVLTYSIFTGAGFFASQAWHLGVFRFIAALGMGGEWAVAVALVVECWPERYRPMLAGAIGAAANFGFLLIGIVAYTFPVVTGSWRWMMLVGATPAALGLLISLIVPESERWKASVQAEQNHAGASSSRVSGASRLRRFAALSVVASAMACFLVFVLHQLPASEQSLWMLDAFARLPSKLASRMWLFPVIGGALFSLLPMLLFPRKTWRAGYLAIAFSAIPLIGTWAAVSGWIPLWVEQMKEVELVRAELVLTQTGPSEGQGADVVLIEARKHLPTGKWSEIQRVAARSKAGVQIIMAVGAILACFVAPVVGGFWGRRPVYFGLCLLSLLLCALLFRAFEQYNWPFVFMAFFVGGITAAFYGWLPLYLPELFPTRIRATGQGLSFNFGRVLAAMGTFCMGQFVIWLGGDYGGAMATITLIYAVGLVVIWFAPETKGKPLPE